MLLTNFPSGWFDRLVVSSCCVRGSIRGKVLNSKSDFGKGTKNRSVTFLKKGKNQIKIESEFETSGLKVRWVGKTAKRRQEKKSTVLSQGVKKSNFPALWKIKYSAKNEKPLHLNDRFSHFTKSERFLRSVFFYFSFSVFLVLLEWVPVASRNHWEPNSNAGSSGTDGNIHSSLMGVYEGEPVGHRGMHWVNTFYQYYLQNISGKNYQIEARNTLGIHLITLMRVKLNEF